MESMENQKMSTCNRMDLESLGSWPTPYGSKTEQKVIATKVKEGER